MKRVAIRARYQHVCLERMIKELYHGFALAPICLLVGTFALHSIVQQSTALLARQSLHLYTCA